MRFSRLSFHLALVLVISSCSSGKKQRADYSELKLGQRIVKQTKDPFSIKSPFQKEVYNASREVKTSGFKTGEFQGKKNQFFGGKDKFKAGSFAQSDKASHAGEKTFSGADDKSSLGNSTFKTTENQFAGKMNSNVDRISPLGNDVFKTGADPMTRKAASNAKRPLILDEPGYSEDQVKKLLKKD